MPEDRMPLRLLKANSTASEVTHGNLPCLSPRDDKATLGGVNVQQYLENLNKEDPVLSMPDDFIMVRGGITVVSDVFIPMCPGAGGWSRSRLRLILPMHRPLVLWICRPTGGEGGGPSAGAGLRAQGAAARSVLCAPWRASRPRESCKCRSRATGFAYMD
jgi:hypothetical protein